MPHSWARTEQTLPYRRRTGRAHHPAGKSAVTTFPTYLVGALVHHVGMENATPAEKPYQDTYLSVQTLSEQLAAYWADNRLIAPDGVDIDELMTQVDLHLFAAESLPRPEFGRVQTR